MGSSDLGLINKWLRNIKEVYAKHDDELKSIADEDARFKRLVELNVEEQVKTLLKQQSFNVLGKTSNCRIFTVGFLI